VAAAGGGGGNGGKVPAEEVWAVQPDEMLVQKRGGQRRAIAQHEADAHHPGQGQPRRRHTRNLHQLTRSPCLSCPLVRWGGAVTDG